MKLTRSYKLKIYPNFHKLEDIRYSVDRYRLYQQNFINQLYFNQHIPYYSTKGMGKLANIAQREARGQVKSLHAKRSSGGKTSPPELTSDLIPGRISKSVSSSFDYWISITSLWRNNVYIPALSHKKLNQKLRSGWKLSKECKIQKFGQTWFALVYVTKVVDRPELKAKSLGVDVGINHGVSRSDNYQSAGLYSIIKVEQDKQKQRSRNHHLKKPFKTRLKQVLDREVTRVLRRSVDQGYSIVVEDPKTLANLTNLGRLGRWARSYFANRLIVRAPEEGIWVSKVNPAYTSQRCSNCRVIDKQSRAGSKFHCVACDFQSHADLNAVRNLAWMGREKVWCLPKLRPAKAPTILKKGE